MADITLKKILNDYSQNFSSNTSIQVVQLMKERESRNINKTIQICGSVKNVTSDFIYMECEAEISRKYEKYGKFSIECYVFRFKIQTKTLQKDSLYKINIGDIFNVYGEITQIKPEVSLHYQPKKFDIDISAKNLNKTTHNPFNAEDLGLSTVIDPYKHEREQEAETYYKKVLAENIKTGIICTIIGCIIIGFGYYQLDHWYKFFCYLIFAGGALIIFVGIAAAGPHLFDKR